MGSAATVLQFDPLPFEPERHAPFGRRSFPTREDYQDAAVANGFPPHLIWREPLFVTAVMRHWHQTGQTGCLFARHLARKVEPPQWPSLVLCAQGDELEALVADVVPSALTEAKKSSECEILSLLVPAITDLGELRDLCGTLTRTTEITMEEDRSHPGWVTVALRLDITGEGNLSWIMAFGPFSSSPPSRQAPVTELAIRVKPKPNQLFHKLNQDHSAAHLADTPLPLTEQQMNLIFERTGKATRDVLGAEPDFRSAARTTFSYCSDGET